MDSYALLMVTGTTTDGFRGLLIDPDRPKADWPEIEVEFRAPGKRTPHGERRTWKDRQTYQQIEPERREAFAAARAAAELSSIMKFEFARGYWTPEGERSFMLAFEVKLLCDAKRAAELMALTADTPERDPDWRSEDWSAWERWQTPFGQAIKTLIYPDRDLKEAPARITSIDALTRELYEHECDMERVRHEPSEGILYIGSDRKAVVFDHHGAFLFYARENGNCAEDIGIKPIPDGLERGLYYFTGNGWGSGPDINGEYDSGFDLETIVKADASHFALFKSEAAAIGYAEDIENYESEVDEFPVAPVV